MTHDKSHLGDIAFEIQMLLCQIQDECTDNGDQHHADLAFEAWKHAFELSQSLLNQKHSGQIH